MDPVKELKKIAAELEFGEYEQKLESALTTHDKELLGILKKLLPYEKDLMQILEKPGDLPDHLYDIETQLGTNIKDLYKKAFEMSFSDSEVQHIEDMVASGDISQAISYAYVEMEEKLGLV